MREQLQRRLEELKKEFAMGQTRASDLDKQLVALHQTLLRISGAIQVLEEELKMQPKDDGQNCGISTQADPNHVNGSLDHVAT